MSASDALCESLESIQFDAPVANVYNPLRYARQMHQAYLERVEDSKIRVVFLGMNPGPWGMAQTGIPFGEIDAVRSFLKIDRPIGVPAIQHPKRLVEGLSCERSEVSGRRLWGLMKDRFKTAKRFFSQHFVLNYCPLVFMESTGRNRTPDKLPPNEREPMGIACDQHLAVFLKELQPKFVVGVGVYAENCLKRVCESMKNENENFDPSIQISRILHPSPASPAANKDWSGSAIKSMVENKVWKES